MSSRYEILVDVPIPKKLREIAPPSERKYPLNVLRIGEMFFIPHRSCRSVAPHISTQGKIMGRKFSVRKIYMHRPGLYWEPADADTPDAVLGVGVWRLE